MPFPDEKLESFIGKVQIPHPQTHPL